MLGCRRLRTRERSLVRIASTNPSVTLVGMTVTAGVLHLLRAGSKHRPARLLQGGRDESREARTQGPVDQW
jgi:hypothetical protein